MNEQQNKLLEKEAPKKYKYLPNTNKSESTFRKECHIKRKLKRTKAKQRCKDKKILKTNAGKNVVAIQV